MKLSRTVRETYVEYEIKLDSVESRDGQGQGGTDIELINTKFRFYLAPEVTELIHPDLEAVALLTVTLPWIDKKIEFPQRVSAKLAQVVEDLYGFKVVSVDNNLSHRKAGKVHSVSFSGGNDSVATALLMPSTTKKITFGRKSHPEIPKREDNTKQTVEATVRRLEAELVQSDLEYIVGPYLQFPTWIALASPCVLLAQKYNLKSIAFGSIAGSSQVKNGKKYKKLTQPDLKWNKLLEAVGLMIVKPVAGVTEITTAKIVRANKLEDKTTSCTIGRYGEPCMNCKKCLRKFVVISHLQGSFDKSKMKQLERSEAVKNSMLEDLPLYFQHIFMGSLNGVRFWRLSKVFRLFAKKILIGVESSEESMAWIYKNDPEALKRFVPDEELYERVASEIKQYAPDLTRSELKALKSWDIESQIKGNERRVARLNSKIKRVLEKED